MVLRGFESSHPCQGVKVMEKKIFLTEYKKNGKSYGDRIEAHSWWEAELLLIQTGRDEKVIGELVDEWEFS